MLASQGKNSNDMGAAWLPKVTLELIFAESVS